MNISKFSTCKLRYFIKLYRLTPLVRLIITKKQYHQALLEYYKRKR